MDDFLDDDMNAGIDPDGAIPEDPIEDLTEDATPVTTEHKPGAPRIDDKDWSIELSDTHREVLASRGVNPAIATRRGYRSSDNRNEIRKYGFSRGQSEVVKKSEVFALMIPLYRPDWSIDAGPASWQMRPDEPRNMSGRIMKYESPAKAATVADIHPDHIIKNADGVAPVENADIPLLITEGIPKADSVYSAAAAKNIPLVTVALTGVTMWSQKRPGMFRTLSDDIRAAAITGRKIYLAFDGDWKTNRMVQRELRTLAITLEETREADVFIVEIPDLENVNKTGVDDWLAAGGDIEELLSRHARRFEDSSLNDYGAADIMADPDEPKREIPIVDPEREIIYELRERKSSDPEYSPPPERIELAGFVAQIEKIEQEKQIVEYQFEPVSAMYTVRISWKDGERQEVRHIQVPTTEIYNLRRWSTTDPHVAARYLSHRLEDERKIVSAILAYSTDMRTEEATSANSGWYRDQQIGKWRYVTSVGSIGADGDFAHSPKINIRSSGSNTRHLRVDKDHHLKNDELVGWLNDMVLGATAVSGLPDEACISFGSQHREQGEWMSLPYLLSLGAMWAARGIIPGAPAKSPIYLVGSPRVGKTALGRVWASHFSPYFAQVPFAGLTSSTAAGIETVLQSARGFSAVVDDFIVSSQAHTQSMSSVIDRATRHAHDGSGRVRSSRDLKAIVPAQPEVTLAFTGEDLPSVGNSDSLVSRLLTLHIPVVPPKEVLDWVHNYLRDEAMLARSNTAISSMIAWVAEKLDSMSFSETGTAGAVTQFRKELEVEAYDIVEQFLRNEKKNLKRGAANERTIAGLRSLAMGAAVILGWGRDNGIITDEYMEDAVVVSFRQAMSYISMSSTEALSASSPPVMLAQRIPELLVSGRMHIATPEGMPPDDPNVAMQWGWRVDGDRIVPQGNRVGLFINASRYGKPAVCFIPSALAASIPNSDELRDMTTRKVARLLSEMTYFDDEGERHSVRLDEPAKGRNTSQIVLNGNPMWVLVVDAEALNIAVPKEMM